MRASVRCGAPGCAVNARNTGILTLDLRNFLFFETKAFQASSSLLSKIPRLEMEVVILKLIFYFIKVSSLSFSRFIPPSLHVLQIVQRLQYLAKEVQHDCLFVRSHAGSGVQPPRRHQISRAAAAGFCHQRVVLGRALELRRLLGCSLFAKLEALLIGTGSDEKKGGRGAVFGFGVEGEGLCGSADPWSCVLGSGPSECVCVCVRKGLSRGSLSLYWAAEWGWGKGVPHAAGTSPCL